MRAFEELLSKTMRELVATSKEKLASTLEHPRGRFCVGTVTQGLRFHITECYPLLVHSMLRHFASGFKLSTPLSLCMRPTAIGFTSLQLVVVQTWTRNMQSIDSKEVV